MQPLVSDLQVKEFRCFKDHTFTFSEPIVLIEGENGTGKTSLIEALHFLCYVRSFRTAFTQDLIAYDQAGFFISATLAHDDLKDTIKIGVVGSQRSVKINDQTATSYKELLAYYRVITITEHDLALIQDGPTERRQFIDQIMSIQNPHWTAFLKKAIDLNTQRTRALYTNSCSPSLYESWTETLWQYTRMIQLKRIEYLTQLEEAMARLIQTGMFAPLNPVITLKYRPKLSCLQDMYGTFVHENRGLQEQETRAGRALFGFQFDDIEIQLGGRHTRHYASRGQQKLILLLLRAAQLTLLEPSKGPTVIILDDFLTDLDDQRVRQLIGLLCSLGSQLIITSPRTNTLLRDILTQCGKSYQTINLSKL